jgi:hypothetical protein
MQRPDRSETSVSAADRVRVAGERAREEAEARRLKTEPDALAPREIGGAEGPEPTRFGDWEKNGRASDF